MIDNKGVIAFSIGKERKLAGRGWLFWASLEDLSVEDRGRE